MITLYREAVASAPLARPALRVRSADRSVVARWRSNSGPAQFERFVLVGGISSAVYAGLFLALAPFGDQPANVAGAIASSALANELHRRLTFRAGQRVSWQSAQWEGGLLAAVGMVATSVALGWWNAVAGSSSAVSDLAVIAVVTGGIGLARFVSLRWLFAPRPAPA